MLASIYRLQPPISVERGVHGISHGVREWDVGPSHGDFLRPFDRDSAPLSWEGVVVLRVRPSHLARIRRNTQIAKVLRLLVVHQIERQVQLAALRVGNDGEIQ
jgi:hypothetical protein